MALRLATGEAPESTAQVFRPVLVRRQSSAAAPQEIR
jgi:LacI family transcriptional regulator